MDVTLRTLSNQHFHFSQEDLAPATEKFIEKNTITNPVCVRAKELPNGVNTPLYHLSENDSIEGYWTPRLTAQIADDDTTVAEAKKFLKAESFIPRICFSDCLELCVETASVSAKQAFKKGTEYIDGYYYVPTLKQNTRIITPEIAQQERYVWDAWFTHEYSSLDPVYMRLFCKARIYNFNKAKKVEVIEFNEPPHKGTYTSSKRILKEDITVKILKLYK